MPLKILVATGNLHKVREISAMLPLDAGVEFLTLKDFPGIVMPEENGASLTENAVIKAHGVAKQSRIFTLADDTGLEVSSLGGAPGVFSARYAGVEHDYRRNNEKLLAEMSGKTDRSARFRCVMAFCSGDCRKIITEEGILEGEIGREYRGENGFGYDPLFIMRGTDRTLAELRPEEKNSLSHRYNAIQKMIPHILAVCRGPAEK